MAKIDCNNCSAIAPYWQLCSISPRTDSINRTKHLHTDHTIQCTRILCRRSSVWTSPRIDDITSMSSNEVNTCRYSCSYRRHGYHLHHKHTQSPSQTLCITYSCTFVYLRLQYVEMHVYVTRLSHKLAHTYTIHTIACQTRRLHSFIHNSVCLVFSSQTPSANVEEGRKPHKRRRSKRAR